MVDLAFGATAMASIFAIVDPLGVVPFFSVLTEDMDKAQKQNIISKACLTAAITTVMILMSSSATAPEDKLFVFAGILVSVLATYILLHNADRIFRRLGRAGTRAVGRVMGLLIAAIAVQFVIDGIVEVARMHGILLT